jgi:methionine sulfoxide reductase catalytic subunit
VAVEGEVHKPKVFDIEKLLKLAPMEERIYRFRFVEAWSTVVPWLGYPLAELLKKVEPTGNAKYVEFISLHDPEQMPGQSRRCWNGRTAKVCAWTKPSILWHC